MTNDRGIAMIRAVAALVLAIASQAVPAMEAADAYAAIPHRRTPYESSTSSLTAPQSASLQRLFALTDRGVVLRVQGMQAQRARDAAGVRNVLLAYDALIAEVGSVSLDRDVAPARAKIADALQAQRRFLAGRPQGGMSFVRSELAAAGDVSAASRNLHDAYDVLMRAFPKETPRNKTSFYDHLCALDYL